MTRRPRLFSRRFAADQRGAVAATYALALVPLIAMAGVGMDYARLMGMDSELQNGADQAALAAATQLDGKAGACTRASSAAIDLVTNTSLLTSDDNTITLTAATDCSGSTSIKFWQDKAKTIASTADGNANYVEVTVDVRGVDYALLPITGLLRGDVQAAALAGLGSAICKQPPLMLCNPLETGTNKEFDAVAHIGKGVRLMANDGAGIAPGNFGFLETNAGTGASVLLEVLARPDRPGDCVAVDNVTTETGVKASVMDAFNTRFGIYGNGLNQACGRNGELCPPSINSRNDLQYQNCSGSSSFRVGGSPYRPTSVAPLADPTGLDPMGYPRDLCHAVDNAGQCAAGPLGTGVWDRNAYFVSNRQIYTTGQPATSVFSGYGDPRTPTSVEPTRYQVYKYESANASKLARQGDFQGSPICNAPGISPSGPTPDRRVLSVAVINCQQEGVGGKTHGVDVLKFVDVFLVEPSFARGSGQNKRTEKTDLYVEIIGETTLGGGAAQGQNVRRDVPYLIE